MSFYCDFSKFSWPDLLEFSVERDQAIFYNEKKGSFFLDAKDTPLTDRAIRQLNLQEILDFTERVKDIYAKDETALGKMGLALQLMAYGAEKEESSAKISTIFTSFFNSVNGKGFQSTSARAQDLANRLFEQIKVPVPIIYNQRQKEIQQQVSVKKVTHAAGQSQCVTLGEGSEGTVYVRRLQASHAIKKSFYNIQNEYILGILLKHPNFNKTHRLYIKRYEETQKVRHPQLKYKLVMDKIEGVRLTEIYGDQAPKLSDAVVKSLLQQAEDCCLYLFDQNIAWKDVNSKNIFVTEENQLKICDFGYWKKQTDPQKKTLSLLLGSIELVEWILKSAQSLPDHPSPNQDIVFPKECFDEQMIPHEHEHIYSIDDYKYKEEAWLQKIQQKLEKMTDKEKQDFLKNYFKKVWVHFILR